MSFATQENMPPISKELFQCIRMFVPKGATILELGSGPGSTVELLNAGYDVRSIEHNQAYMCYNKSENYIYCPLIINGNIQAFYNLDLIKDKLPDYKALLIDGPDTGNRMAEFNKNYHYFNPKVHWFIDDYAYPPMTEDINELQKITGREMLKFEVGAKQFAVLLGEGI